MTKKSIKLEDGYYWDTSSIINDKQTLTNFIQNYNNRKLLEFKGSTSIRDFNSFYTPGIYSIGGDYQNAPRTGTIYGVLIVITNDGGIWRKTDSDSWLWQIFFTTGAAMYVRNGINSTVPESWKSFH